MVSSDNDPELSLPAKGNVTEAEVIVNARVEADPAMLEEQVRRSLPEVCRKHHATVVIQSMQSFRPGRPQPTHRYAVAK